MLSVLRLFTAERPVWTIEEVARELGLAQATAYDYFRSLVGAELLTSARNGRYAVGPAITELDRIVRRTDPLLTQGTSFLDDLVANCPAPAVALLCRFYRMRVMCVSERTSNGASFEVSYERGRPMPLFRGAASKSILAHVERRWLRRYYDDSADEVAANGLGSTWEEFRVELRRIRSKPVCVTFGELDPGLVGISAPVFLANDVVGSISLVVDAEPYSTSESLRSEIHARIARSAEALTARLVSEGAAG